MDFITLGADDINFCHGLHPKMQSLRYQQVCVTTGKCHFHTCLVFNKQAYYYLGDDKSEDSLKGMITKAWYSALGLELDDYPGLVHFPENCKYILDKHSPDYLYNYGMLFVRLDYLTKLDSKIYEKGERNFGCSRK